MLSGTWSWIFFIVGLVSFGYGIYLTITRKPNKEKLNTHTLESLKKYALVEGISSMIIGASLVLAGLFYSDPSFGWLLYVCIGLIVVCIVGEFILEKKIIKPIENSHK